MVSEGERELLSGRTWERMVDLEPMTVVGEKRRYKYPLGPNGRLSVVVPHLTRGTAALKVRHCHTCQDNKGQDLNSRLPWL
jgi:hypothetical protein